MRIPRGYKYGLIALRNLRLADNLPHSIQLREDLWFAAELPFDIPEHWEDWVGSIKAQAVARSSLFILSSAPSTRPDILNRFHSRLASIPSPSSHRDSSRYVAW